MIDNIKSTTVFQGGQRQTKPARRFIRKFSNDWSMDFSAMLAYNLLIALLPIAVALFGITGLVLKSHPDTQKRVKDKIIDLFPADNTTQTGIKQVVDLAFNQLSKDAGLILAIGIFFALFGSSRLFIAIDKCMTIVYRLPQRTFLRQNLLAFGMLFLFITIIPIMLAASSAPSALMSIIPGGGGRFGTFIAGMVFSLLAAFIFFESIYWFVPNKKMSFKVTWCGALVAACTLEIFIILFPLYVRRFMGNYAGQIGFAVILLLFFFYFATILILGAQINAFFFEHYQPLVDGLGTYISQMHQEHGVGAANKPLIAAHTKNDEL
ncbi:unnamed protein product [Rotaria sordida]|uniref:YihY/virulence factor BrkB family protein n=1 Tax=Rotaria sordida TaxID=392033 RepID=A0A814GMT7_9BILA|nr:unnamed protein product [Rotaria sordida]CAF0996901.1 unnamed protein product [Rotaria sordida]CAF0998552.1 unnamed protein product [Rotaria sordida]CAF1043173.1 unnamed protein product [Rotaria sordida]CAF3633075.1 unnamed protein product [Rotaria sordida]